MDISTIMHPTDATPQEWTDEVFRALRARWLLTMKPGTGTRRGFLEADQGIGGHRAWLAGGASAHTWASNSVNWKKLEAFSKAVQGKGAFRTVLDEKMTSSPGATFWSERIIRINPYFLEWMGDINDQHEYAKGLMIHEACHRRYTDHTCFKPEYGGYIHSLWNLLEDGRIETTIVRDLYPQLEELLNKLAANMLLQMGDVKLAGDIQRDLFAFLCQYSFYRRSGSMINRLMPTDVASTIDGWGIKHLVDRSFDVSTSEEVLDIVLEIMDIMELDNSTSQPEGADQAMPCSGGEGGRDEEEHGEPEKGSATTEREDGESAQGEGESGDGEESDGQGDGGWVFVDNVSSVEPNFEMQEQPHMAGKCEHEDGVTRPEDLIPMSPVDVVERAGPLVGPLVKALEQDTPNPVKELGSSGKRLKMGAWIRTPSTPFEKRVEQSTKTKLAIGMIVDCSGSMMGEPSKACADITMAIYQACNKTDTTMRAVTAPGAIEICNSSMHTGHAMPLIAGIAGPWAGYEQMNAMLKIQGEWLAQQPEDIKLLFALHDGMSNDASEVNKTVHDLMRKGIKVIALGLGMREQLLKEQFGERNYIAIDDVSMVAKKISPIIKNMSRR